jgi:hypothetical protein
MTTLVAGPGAWRSTPRRSFRRHFFETVVAMLVGMAVFGSRGPAALCCGRIPGLPPGQPRDTRARDGGEHDDRDVGVDAAPRPRVGPHRRDGRRDVRSPPGCVRPVVGGCAVRWCAAGSNACLDAPGHVDRDAPPARRVRAGPSTSLRCVVATAGRDVGAGRPAQARRAASRYRPQVLTSPPSYQSVHRTVRPVVERYLR